jgi:hypothetical protein
MWVNPVAHVFTHHITSTHRHLWPTLFVALKAQVIFTFVQSSLTWGWLKWTWATTHWATHLMNTWATTHWNLKLLLVHNALLGSSFVFTIQAVLVMAWANFSLLPSGISSKVLTIATTYPDYGKTKCNNAPEYNLKKEWVFSLHPKLQILCRNFAYKQQASKQSSVKQPWLLVPPSWGNHYLWLTEFLEKNNWAPKTWLAPNYKEKATRITTNEEEFES